MAVSSPAVGEDSERLWFGRLTSGRGTCLPPSTYTLVHITVSGVSYMEVSAGLGGGSRSCLRFDGYSPSSLSYDGNKRSSSSDEHGSSNERLLDGVERYDGWFEKSGWTRRGEDGADEGTEAECLVSYWKCSYFVLRSGEEPA